MPRLIVSYRGEGAKPEEDVAKLRDAPSVTVIDESLPRMVLVDGAEDEVRELLQRKPVWSIAPEKTFKLPGPHPAASRLNRSSRKSKRG